MIPQAEVDGVMATDEVRFRRDGTIQKTAYPVRVPNEIPGLVVWLVPNDRAGAPVEWSGPNAGRPLNFDLWPLANRTGRGEARGTATLAPGWGGQCADMSIAVDPRRYVNCEIGSNRFSAGWTYLMLWWPYVEQLAQNFYSIQMAYRLSPGANPEGVGFSPAILTGNFTGEGTGFLAYAFDVATRVTSQLNIEWGSGAGWYMVGADGQSGQSFKCRVNGINSPPTNLGTLSTLNNQQIIWGPGVGLLLEGCVYDRRLSDEEYSVIEDYWRIKYNNIALGTVSLGRAPSASELLTAFRRKA